MKLYFAFAFAFILSSCGGGGGGSASSSTSSGRPLIDLKSAEGALAAAALTYGSLDFVWESTFDYSTAVSGPTITQNCEQGGSRSIAREAPSSPSGVGAKVITSYNKCKFADGPGTLTSDATYTEQILDISPTLFSVGFNLSASAEYDFSVDGVSYKLKTRSPASFTGTTSSRRSSDPNASSQVLEMQSQGSEMSTLNGIEIEAQESASILCDATYFSATCNRLVSTSRGSTSTASYDLRIQNTSPLQLSLRLANRRASAQQFDREELASGEIQVSQGSETSLITFLSSGSLRVIDSAGVTRTFSLADLDRWLLLYGK